MSAREYRYWAMLGVILSDTTGASLKQKKQKSAFMIDKLLGYPWMGAVVACQCAIVEWKRNAKQGSTPYMPIVMMMMMLISCTQTSISVRQVQIEEGR